MKKYYNKFNNSNRWAKIHKGREGMRILQEREKRIRDDYSKEKLFWEDSGKRNNKSKK